SGSVLGSTASHTPSAAPVRSPRQAWHSPLQVDSQQTPSTQRPDSHSFGDAHSAPRGRQNIVQLAGAPPVLVPPMPGSGAPPAPPSPSPSPPSPAPPEPPALPGGSILPASPASPLRAPPLAPLAPPRPPARAPPLALLPALPPLPPPAPPRPPTPT